MAKKLFSKADEESIDIVERAIDDLRKLGATIVDPGPEGALFQGCIARYAPVLLNSVQYRDLIPGAVLSLRSSEYTGCSGRRQIHDGQVSQERGDANIKTGADLISKARFYEDPNFPDRKQARQAAERATVLDTSARLQTRFALQNLLLQCMAEQRLDALVSPMSTVPPRKLTAPREPNANGRSPIGWSLIGQQGFPAITVPAGFTTEIWDRVRDGDGTRLVGPSESELAGRR